MNQRLTFVIFLFVLIFLLLTNRTRLISNVYEDTVYRSIIDRIEFSKSDYREQYLICTVENGADYKRLEKKIETISLFKNNILLDCTDIPERPTNTTLIEFQVEERTLFTQTIGTHISVKTESDLIGVSHTYKYVWNGLNWVFKEQTGIS